MDIFRNDEPDMERSTAEVVFLKAQLLYPMILLVAFVLSAGVHSILTSRSEEELITPTATGPGGKPLPVTKRKREHEEPQILDIDEQSSAHGAFQYIAAAVVLTFLANCVAVVVHGLDSAGKSHEWWCSEQRMVRLPPLSPNALSESGPLGMI